jgi:nucleoside 2-deoxyribosyltransferase
LEEIALVLENNKFETFLPHRDAGLVEGEFTDKLREDIFITDIEALEKADTVVALLTGRDIDSGTAAEIGYAYACKKELIGVSANNIKALNTFVWGLFDSGKKIVKDINELEEFLNAK